MLVPTRPAPKTIRAVRVVKLSFAIAQSLDLGPTIADAGPANDGKLRTANIQGFKILQGVLCPSVGGSVIILPKP